MYEVRVSADVARRARDGSGTRRRAGHVFSRQPTFLDDVPPEVRNDPHLEVREVAEGTPKKQARRGRRAPAKQETDGED